MNLLRMLGPTELAFIFVVLLVPFALYCRTLQKALERCSPASRPMTPWKVWLLAVPIFNIGWQCVVIVNVSRTLRNEFQRRRAAEFPENPGRTAGSLMSILTTSSLLPVVGVFLLRLGTLCWIIHWVQIARYSGRLNMRIRDEERVRSAGQAV